TTGSSACARAAGVAQKHAAAKMILKRIDRLHLPEKMRVGLAYLEQLGPVLEPEDDMAFEVAPDAFHGVQVHDRRAVHLPEARRIELFHELLDRLANEALAL